MPATYYGPLSNYRGHHGNHATNIRNVLRWGRIARGIYRTQQQGGFGTWTRQDLWNQAKEYSRFLRENPSYKGKSTKKTTKQTKGNIHTGGYTAYGSNYSKNIKTKGSKKWKGKLTIPHSKKKTKQYNKKFPHTIMQRYFLCPPGNLDSNNVLSFPQDMFTSNPSLDAKHMSTVVLKLSACENHLNAKNYHLGKNLVPYSMGEYVGANTIVWENNAANTALESVQIPYQVNKFPVSAFASRWMDASTYTGNGAEFEMPSSVITGVNLNLVFKSGGQPFDQILSVKVIRCNLPVAFKSGDWASADGVVPAEIIQREITNRGQFTSRLAFDTIFTKSILLRHVKGGAQKIPTVRLKKFIKMQYLRSTIRKVSTAGNQATIGSQALPSSYESQDGYFNNLYVVISSKCVDDQYVATVTRDIPASISTIDDQNTREEMGALRAIPPTQLNGEGLAVNKQTCFFRYGGTFSVYRKVKEADSGITGGLNQTAANVLSLQEQLNNLNAIVQEQINHDSDCTSCESDSDPDEEPESDNNSENESENESDEDCGSGHSAGATVSDSHVHPNNMTAQEHDAECQHSH